MVTLANSNAPANFAARRTASWLLSNYDDPEWIVQDGPNNRNETKNATINFAYRLPSGRLLTSPENAELLAVVKAYCFLMREHEYAEIETAATQYSQMRSVFSLLGWMDLQGIRSFAEFTPNDVKQYVLDAKFGLSSTLHVKERLLRLKADGIDLSDHQRVRELLHLPSSLSLKRALEELDRNDSERTPLRHMPLLRALLPLEELWLWRDEIGPGAMQFRPFEVSASATAARHCSITNRTKTIPDRQAMVLLDGCLRMVLELGPIIISLHKASRAIASSWQSRDERSARQAALLRDRAADFKLLKKRLNISLYEPHGPAPFIDVAVKLLFKMCFILAAALSARRHDEILSAEEGCIRGNAKDGLWIYSAILKNERQRQHTPVPEIVQHIMALLTELSAEARATSGNQKLFQWCQTKTAKMTKVVAFKAERLNEVARLCNVPSYEGEEWNFTPRQFRRFFAIIYMWRYHHGDLAALKHHLRHWDFQTTRAYASDPEIGRIFTEEQREMTRRIVVEAATGDRSVGGAAGIRIRAIVDRRKKKLENKMIPMTMDRLIPWAERLASKIFLKCNPWSYCTSPETEAGAREANCRRGTRKPGDKGANIAAARPETCSGCKYNMTDDVFTPFLDTEVRQTRAVIENPRYAGTLLGTVAKQRLEVIEPYLQQNLALSEADT